jgi:DICT domain-containing protein
MGAEPVPGDPTVRGADLASDDVLRGEWVVTVVGPHFAGALIAKDLLDGGPDRQRRFLFTITYDRDQVIRAANSLLRRVIPEL